MKRNIRVSFAIVLFCVGTVYSQSKGGNATYTFILNFPQELNKDIPNNLSQSMEMALASAENIELNLMFNAEYSVFLGGKQEGIPNRDEETALAFCGCSNDYYVDISSKTITYNSPERRMTGRKKDEFLIRKPMETDWVLSGESKEINSIKCYKAIQTITYNNGLKDFTKVVTAWYAPEIPYSFGPNGYGGLPGLILELHDRFVTFGLKSINFSQDEPKIEFPEKGKQVTYEEYEGIIKEDVKRVRENMESMESNRR